MARKASARTTKVTNSTPAEEKEGAKLLARIKKIVGAMSAAFAGVTACLWVFLCVGSWRDVDRPMPYNSGCLEFDLRPSIKGILYAPSRTVFTKYSGGYVLGNWVGLDFEARREGKKQEYGTAFAWLNPFDFSLTLHYKIQGFGEESNNGYRESEGLRLKWNIQSCPS